jgi:hypothetical protein
MDKKRILASLNEVATSLENSGFYNEADEITVVMKKVAQMNMAPASGATSRDLNWKWIQTTMGTPQFQAAMASPQPMAALLNSGIAIPAGLDQLKIAQYLNALKRDPRGFAPGI